MKKFHATQNVGVTQVGDQIWLVTFMHHDLKYFDDEPCRAEPIENPDGPNVFRCAQKKWLTTLDSFRNWLLNAA